MGGEENQIRRGSRFLAVTGGNSIAQEEELVNLLRWNDLRLGLAIALLIWHGQIDVLSLG
jgi:hypothetical protein